jgi:hypothetical protein
MLALWRSTPYGLGLVNDSATYIEGATNLLQGRGYVRVSGGGEIKPITHFPPLFSLLLAGLGLFGLDLLQAARVLATFLFGLDVLLVGLSIYKISRSIVFAAFGAFLLAVSDLHLGVYSFALSEPLFITLLLVAFLCLAESFENQHWAWLVFAGAILSLAYLTRFAGASLVITAIFVILLLHPPKLLRRLLFLLVGVLPPFLGWQVYNLNISGAETLGNRQLLWHPVPLKTLFEAYKNLLTWIAPNDLLANGVMWGRLLSLLSVALLPALAAMLIWVTLDQARKPQTAGAGIALAFTHGLHILVYLAFMVASLTFFDASTPLNDRILSVVYIPEMILFSSALAWLWARFRWRTASFRWALAVFSILLLIFSAKDGYAAAVQLGREGQGFAHRGISGSPAFREIRLMKPTVIYSNKPGGIFLLTGKTAYVTPTAMDPVTHQVRPGFVDDLNLMQQRIRDGQAIMVLFDLRYSDDPSEVDLYNRLSNTLAIQADYGEIVIFGASP